MAEPLPERIPAFEEMLKTAFIAVAQREIETDGTFKAEEVSEFIHALANWHVTQSIIEGQKTLLQTNQESKTDLEKKVQEKTVTEHDLGMIENVEQNITDQLYQIRLYEGQAENYQKSLEQSIKNLSLENEALEEKLWVLSDHLSAFARDIYKRTTKET